MRKSTRTTSRLSIAMSVLWHWMMMTSLPVSLHCAYAAPMASGQSFGARQYVLTLDRAVGHPCHCCAQLLSWQHVHVNHAHMVSLQSSVLPHGKLSVQA